MIALNGSGPVHCNICSLCIFFVCVYVCICMYIRTLTRWMVAGIVYSSYQIRDALGTWTVHRYSPRYCPHPHTRPCACVSKRSFEGAAEAKDSSHKEFNDREPTLYSLLLFLLILKTRHTNTFILDSHWVRYLEHSCLGSANLFRSTLSFFAKENCSFINIYAYKRLRNLDQGSSAFEPGMLARWNFVRVIRLVLF